jgi:hypothetical protein
MSKSIEQRLKEYSTVDLKTDCWNWQHYANKQGQGYISYDNKLYLASRLSYMIFIGPIPEGLNVCHKCDNPKCVNPKHFFLGTDFDNMQDCQSKGRNRRILNDEQIKQLKKDRVIGMTYKNLADKYAIKLHTAYQYVKFFDDCNE